MSLKVVDRFFELPYGRVVRMFNTTPERSFWDGRTASGTEVPPGIYFVTVVTQDGQRYTQRVIKQ